MFDSLFPKTIAAVPSEFNGEIKVIRRGKSISLRVDGYEQSGPVVEKVWSQALQMLPKNRYNSVLVLGLGGGALVKIVNHKLQPAKIVGVEIDPVMVELGKKHFFLDKYSNLTILTSDADNYLASSKQKYDLILLDLYVGKNFPGELVNIIFFQRIRQHLAQHGTAVFNYLNTKGTNLDKLEFVSELKAIFKVQKEVKIDFNIFVYCT